MLIYYRYFNEKRNKDIFFWYKIEILNHKWTTIWFIKEGKEPQIQSNTSFYTPASKNTGIYCFSTVSPSARPFVGNQYFPSHVSLQPCITATSNLVWCFGKGSYTSITEFRSASYLLPVLRPSLFSYIPSVTSIFRGTLLRNHASQPLQTWYCASARGPTRRLPNSGPPVIYFFFTT